MARKKRKIKKMRVLFAILLISLIVWGILDKVPWLFGDFKSLEKVIVIDAGHGGRDPGTIGFNGTYEKDINLDISHKLKDKLKARGYKVVFIRDQDDYVDNLARAELANKRRGRVFISVHSNALENDSSTKGIQVLYYPGRTSTIDHGDNDDLAQIMMTSLIRGTGAIDMGIRERPELIVLNQTKMPALIVECGFLSNKNEEELLLTDAYQNKIADSIIDGLEQYFEFEKEE